MQTQTHHPNSWADVCGALFSEGMGVAPIEAIQATPAPIEAVVLQAVPAEPPPVTVEANTAEAPFDPNDLNQIFKEHRKLVASISEMEAKIDAMEVTMFERTLLHDRVKIGSEEDLATNAISRIHTNAEAKYAPLGGKLQINLNDALRAAGMGDWREQYFSGRRANRRSSEKQDVHIEEYADLNKLHAYFEKTYGGDAGRIAGLKQAAKFLIDRFNLKGSAPVNRVKGCIVLQTRVYSSIKDFGSNQGKYEPHSNTNAFKLFEALDTFLIHANPDAKYYTPLIRSDICNYGFAFTPREKRNLGSIEIVFYKERWDFRFDAKTSQDLMLFLGEFGQEE